MWFGCNDNAAAGTVVFCEHCFPPNKIGIPGYHHNITSFLFFLWCLSNVFRHLFPQTGPAVLAQRMPSGSSTSCREGLSGNDLMNGVWPLCTVHFIYMYIYLSISLSLAHFICNIIYKKHINVINCVYIIININIYIYIRKK